MNTISTAQRFLSGVNIALDAGAGTGKTTSLVHSVTSLFLNSELTPEKVLMVTFSEKAAREMRERLIALWQSLYVSFLSKETPLDSILADRQDLYIDPELKNDREKITTRLGEMKGYFGRLNVSTLHSFAYSLLKDFSVEAGIDPDFEIMDNFESQLVFEEAFNTFLIQEFEREGADPAWQEIFSLFPDMDQGLEYVKKLFRLLCLEQRDLLFTRGTKKFIGQEEIISSYFNYFHGPRLRLLKEYMLSSEPSDGNVSRVFNSLLPLLLEIQASTEKGSLPSEKLLEEFSSLLTETKGMRLLKKKEFPLNGEETELPLHKGGSLKEEIIPISFGRLRDRVLESIALLSRLLRGERLIPFLIEKADRMMKTIDGEKGNRLDFMDLLIKSATLIRENRDVRRSLKARFHHVFVDEFQDTDPIQAHICGFICEKEDDFSPDFEHLRLEKGKLFIVGDPRQSIYRFRRADPQVYSMTVDMIRNSGGIHDSLTTNYRSSPALVTFFNELFPALFDKESDYTFGYGHPLTAHRKKRGKFPPISFFEAGEGVDEAPLIAHLVKKSVESGLKIPDGDRMREVRWKDIAILYRGDFGGRVLSPLKEAFEREEIPLIAPALRGFYRRQEVQDLYTLLQAVADPMNRTALYGALKSSFFGFTDDHLRDHFTGQNAGSGPIRDPLSLISRWAAVKDSLGMHELIRTIFDETGCEYSAIIAPEGERNFFNLQKFLILAKEFDIRHQGSLRDFLMYMGRQIKALSEEGELPYFDEGEDAVRAMTVHASKGLEFPIVMLYLTGTPPSSPAGPLLYDRQRKAGGFNFGPLTSFSCYTMVEDRWIENGERGSQALPLISLESRKNEAESLRLTYVAMTRARDSLIVLSTPSHSKVGRSLLIRDMIDRHTSSLRQQEGTCSISGFPGTLVTFPDNTPVFLGQVTHFQANGNEALSKRSTQAFSLPSVDQKAYLDPPHPHIPPFESCTPLVVEETGYLFGKSLHAFFELHPPFSPSFLIRAGKAAGALFHDDEQKRFEALCERIVKSPLASRLARMTLLGTEIPLTSPRGTGHEKDAADCVFIDGKKLVVVDYKTGDREEDKDSLYRAQVARYMRIIEEATGIETEGIVWYVESDEWFEVTQP